jgi:hypothetical protein
MPMCRFPPLREAAERKWLHALQGAIVFFVRCRIQGFGLLQDVQTGFRPGLNLVFAPNEAGKTTFQQFLTAMLFGQWRPDVRSQRRLESWVERYRPWQAPAYGGLLWCRLADGSEIEIRRTFGKDAGLLEVRSASGEDISGRYERQKNGEVLFAQPHLGLPKDLFDSVAVLRETGLGQLQGQASLRDRIANLAQTGVEELSVQQSLAWLSKLLEEIGSDRAPTRPYRLALDRVEVLRSESRELDARRSEYRNWLQARHDAASEVARLEAQLRFAAYTSALARSREAEQRVRALSDLEAEVDRLRNDIAINTVGEAFPVDRLDELNSRAGARDSVQKRLDEMRIRAGEAGALLEQAAAERRPVEDYEALATGGDAEAAIERYHAHLRYAVQRDSAHRQISRLMEQKEELTRELGTFPERISASEENWERAALEAGDSERSATRTIMELSERLGGLRSTLSEISRRASTSRNAGLVSTALAFIFLGLAVFSPGEEVVRWCVGGLALVAAAAAAWLLRRSAGIRTVAQPSEQEASRIQAEISRMKTAAASPQDELMNIVRDSGYVTLDEFLVAARRAGEIRAAVSELDRRVREAEEQRDAAQAQCTELIARVGETLGKVGLGCSPANLARQMDVFRGNLKRFRETDQKHAECRNAAATVERELRELSHEFGKIDSSIAGILRSAGVESVVAFRDACSRRQRELTLGEKLTSRSREQERLLEGRSLQDWREEATRRTVEAAACAPLSDRPAGEESNAETGTAPLLPYLPSVEEAMAEERRVGDGLAAAREQLVRLSERVANAFNGYREPAEIEEDLTVAQAELDGLARERAALEIALETLTSLAREQQESLAPQLNAAVEQRFLRLCDRRYEEVKIDADFAARARVAGSGELREAEALSRGTQDQLYFALRFGLLDLLSRADEPCPSLLDEPFAAYDHSRSEEAFQILAEEAERRQLILFTCREDIRDLALRNGAFQVELAAQSREWPCD